MQMHANTQFLLLLSGPEQLLPDKASVTAVTGRCFGDKDFRGGLENGILLCELLSSIKPSLVKKINRLPTPIAGLDNLSVFLRGCEELGLKGSQLFDPGDLQDTSTRPTVLITIYWLGRAANGCTSYNGPTLDLKEFEGLLSQMRKEAEEAESPKRSIRDSGYIDCWDSERSDSLSPPRHGREDSFDSLDSFGSRSRQTPSPDVLVARGSSDGRGSDSESDGPPHRKMPDIRKDDMLARRTSVSEPRTAMPFNQYLPNKSNQSGYVPTPLRKKKNDKEDGGRKSWSTATSPIGGDRPFRSVSMIDMRGEEEAILQPHSQVRHELMHNQYNRMKEEDDHWQDDLARWKNRRRSISQDLIKKEEERKMMERLMSGDTYTSHRRRSIKTYREIVEDKERREEELREAYRQARTPEEASAILQRYAQRFSISEAVLERLQLPKLLDRSMSADPSFPCSPFPLSLACSPTTPDPFDIDPNGPMRYLRQLSAPAPKFTSTLEARIEEFPRDFSSHPRPQIRSRSSEPPSTRALSPKQVPLLTPKPYFESRATQKVSDQEVADQKVRDQKVAEQKVAEQKVRDQKVTEQKVAEQKVADQEVAQQEIAEQKVSELSTPLCRPTSLPTVRMRSCCCWAKWIVVIFFYICTLWKCVRVCVCVNGKCVHDYLCAMWVFMHVDACWDTWVCLFVCVCVCVCVCVGVYQVSVPVLPQARRGDRWSWDPDEERKRQERWQQEQERMLQEKYRREQEKLKDEWEKAQREVAEEERKYHEEERKILEETVTPLTPRSSALPSPSRGELPSTSGPQDTIVRSLADWERKQEILERQSVNLDHYCKENISSCLSSFSSLAQQERGWRRTSFIKGLSLLSISSRSVSGKKLCSSCGQPLGKGAAMIIETLSLYFHIHCFKCGVCKGQLGDTTTGTDVRIRNGLLNCHQCYIRSRSAGQPTTL
uniref:LIM and calponin homology domains-containing protein 1-like n=1 Tax=Echeneis naucrates TaxID=173247 RepID=A0A665TWX4_ECHNA